MLDLEYFEDSKEFLVIDIVVELGRIEGIEIKGYQIIWGHDRQNDSESIVRNICFYNELSIRDLVKENYNRSKCFFQSVKDFIAMIAKIL